MHGMRPPYQQFFGTAPMPCPYLPGMQERKVVTELNTPDGDLLYEALTNVGFRRTQSMAYKPACDRCSACVAVRVPVRLFRFDRGLRRVMRRNGDIAVREAPAIARREHYELFRRYLDARHADGGMAGMSFADYRGMVEDTPVDTRVIEYRSADRGLVAVCVTDFLASGMSLIYSFFEPASQDRSPGTYVILWHIAHAKAQNLAHVYLGYWIAECRKMSYKARFSPLEGYRDGRWRPLESETSTKACCASNTEI